MSDLGPDLSADLARIEETPEGFWRVRCECAFRVVLGTREAAEDTRRWHLGLPSQIEAWSDVKGAHYES